MMPFYPSGEFKTWFANNWLAFDQQLNTLFNGSPDETFSSRTFRMNDRAAYKRWEVIIDFIFKPFQGPDHCRNAYLKELERRHWPADMLERHAEALARGGNLPK